MAGLPFRRGSSLRELNRQLDTATDYASWMAAANAHDALSGMDRWRQKEDSSLYDSAEIRIRYNRLRELIDSGNTHELLYALNEGIHGNMGGMGRGILYSQARSGTKLLVDEYVNVIVEALNCIADAREADIPLPEKVDFFRRASHCYGRSALMLSGGAGVIYFHHGVVQTLIDEDLLPNVLSGASAGSWLCAQIGTQTDEELKSGYFETFRYDLPTHLNPFRVLAGMEEEASPQTVKEMAIDSFCQDMTFQEAFEHTGRYINVSIAPVEKHQSSRLLNAITSPNVYIRSAIDASSSIPGVVPPVTLYAKGADGRPKPYLPSRKWVDGSFAEDLPAKRLSRLFGVNHYLVSLINPLAVPFVNDPKTARRRSLGSMLSAAGINAVKDVLLAAENYGSRLGASFMSPAILLAHAVLDQKYTGDINIILPKQDFRWMNVLFDYESDEEITGLINAGKRSTWPKLAQIRNATIIARTLDQILEKLDIREFGSAAGSRHITTAT
ncbi:MAG: patatin-like phospholipase family protein [Alcanivoracaceae bacterium]|nr:patatin-like phospholipase family protein [Alcanivoracaceae bacterium]